MTTGKPWPVPVEQIAIDSAGIASLLAAGHYAQNVEHCPGWTITDVVRHLGGVHRWATEIVRTGEPVPGHAPSPERTHELGSWLVEGAVALTECLHQTDAARACWTFGLPPAVVDFWIRRQIVETAVHRADVELAAGLQPVLTTEVAEMGVDEVVDFLYPRQVTLARTPPLAQAVELNATESARSWVIGEGAPAAVVTGWARDLLMMLWGRPHGDLVVEGGPGAIAAFRATALVP